MEALAKLWSYTREYRPAMVAGVAALALAEAAGLLPPWFMKLAVDHIGVAGSATALPASDPLAAYCLLFVAAAGMQAALRHCWRERLFGIPRLLQHRLRQECFGHLQKLSAGFFQRHMVGDIMSKFTNDIDNIDEFIATAVTFVVNVMLIIPACCVLLVTISPKLTAVSLAPATAAALLFARQRRTICALAEAVQEQLAAIYSRVQESVAGIRVIQAYAREDGELARFERANAGLAERKMALTLAADGLGPVMACAHGLTMALVLWLGGREVMAGGMTVGSYLAFIAYLAILTFAVAGVGTAVNVSQQVLGSLRRIEGLLAECVPPRADEEIARGQADRLRQRGFAVKEDFRGALAVRGLAASYDGGCEALAGVDLNVAAGTWLAVAGAVGSGKSTLARAIMGICDVPRGTIFIDGVDSRDIPDALLHEVIGYVDQEPFLFSATIGENIAFGAAGAAGDDIAQAAALAGLDRDLAAMAGGLDTVIGERGVTLSGGQRQRVALARALIRRPRILLLDDACASLDADTEQRVLANIRAAFPTTTLVTISHRVTTLRSADAIAVLDGGRVAELGGHGGLAGRGGLYDRLYKEQLFGEKGLIEE
jgi:ATP-binding cassette subfamily B multidrug efflux pump